MNFIKNKYLVIIPARGGSKAIKDKNLSKFEDSNLISFAIKKFINQKFISSIIVSSDDDKILNVASEFSEVISLKRPKDLSDDLSKSEDALTHAINYANQNGIIFNSIIFHQCTSPLLKKPTIINMLKFYENNKFDSVFTVVEEFNPIWRNVDDNLSILDENKNERNPRQSRTPNYIETGGLYVMDKFVFNNHPTRFCGKTEKYVISKKESIDIDDAFDLELARLIIKLN